MDGQVYHYKNLDARISICRCANPPPFNFAMKYKQVSGSKGILLEINQPDIALHLRGICSLSSWKLVEL